mgnify:CR=1 FL=1
MPRAVRTTKALAKDALYLRSMLGGVDRLERMPLGLLGAKAPEYVRIPFDNAITIKPRRQMSVQFSGGEPTLHPRLFDILDAAKARPSIGSKPKRRKNPCETRMPARGCDLMNCHSTFCRVGSVST